LIIYWWCSCFTCWLLDLYCLLWWISQSSYLINTRCRDIWSVFRSNQVS